MACVRNPWDAYDWEQSNESGNSQDLRAGDYPYDNAHAVASDHSSLARAFGFPEETTQELIRGLTSGRLQVVDLDIRLDNSPCYYRGEFAGATPGQTTINVRLVGDMCQPDERVEDPVHRIVDAMEDDAQNAIDTTPDEPEGEPEANGKPEGPSGESWGPSMTCMESSE